MGYKGGPIGNLHNSACHLVETGRIGHHLVRNTSETSDVWRDIAFGINKGGKLIYNLFAIEKENGDLGYSAIYRASACGFNIYNGKH